MTPAAGRPVAAALVVAAALTLAGCTATSRPDAASSPATRSATPTVTSSSPASSPSPDSSPDSLSVPPSTPATSPSPTVPSSRPATSTSHAPAPPARSTCTSLTIRVLLGSGAPGYEFAALQFVNTGSSACTLVGVPTVSLRRTGQRVGSVSRPSSPGAAYGTYRLAPGATAESKLKDFSSCNAPLSDTIRVVAPGSTLSSARPGELRACTLVTYPLGAPE